MRDGGHKKKIENMCDPHERAWKMMFARRIHIWRVLKHLWKKDGNLVVYIRWMNFSDKLTTVCILQMPELTQAPFMANVCCPSEEFIIASASLCSWQVGVHTLHFKHNNSLSGELFWEQVNLHTNNKKGNCIHHWDTGKQKETKLIKGAEQSCSMACFWL